MKVEIHLVELIYQTSQRKVHKISFNGIKFCSNVHSKDFKCPMTLSCFFQEMFAPLAN